MNIIPEDIPISQNSGVEASTDTDPKVREEDKYLDGQPPSIIGLAERLIVSKIDLLDRESALAKKKFTSNWGVFQDYYRGIHYPPKMPSYKVQAVLNLTLDLVERKAALMTDNRPSIKVVPSIYPGTSNTKLQEHLSNAAQALEAAVLGLWAERRFDEKFARALILAQIFGCVGFDTCWNPSLPYGGDIDVVVLDPRTVQWDPYIYTSEDLNRAEYCIIKDVMSTEYLKSILPPDLAKKITPDMMVSEPDDPGSLGDKIKRLFGFGLSTGESRGINAIDRSLVRTVWLKDYEVNEYGLPKWMGGKHIVVVGTKLIIYEPNPYIDGKFPIDWMDWHTDINSIWGFGDVELYKSPQDIANKMLALIVENAALMSNSIWIGDEDALSPKDWDRLCNIPGYQVKVRRGRVLRRESPPPLGDGATSALQSILGGLEKISGINQALEGRAPSSDASGVMMENLQIVGQTILRLRAKKLEGVMCSIGEKLLARIFQYMTGDRIFNVTGDAGQVTSYLFERKKINNDVIKGFRDFKFQVAPTSSLAMTKTQRGLLAIQLYAQGILDEKAVLDALDYPDRVEIMARIEEKMKANMEAQRAMMEEMYSKGLNKQSPSIHPTSRGGRPNGSITRAILKSSEGDINQRTPGSPTFIKQGA